MSAGYEWRKIRHVTTEAAILLWLAIGAGIAGGVFLVARTAVQIGSVAYRLLEKQLTSKEGAQQTALRPLAIGAALPATAGISGPARWVIFGPLPDSRL